MKSIIQNQNCQVCKLSKEGIWPGNLPRWNLQLTTSTYSKHHFNHHLKSIIMRNQINYQQRLNLSAPKVSIVSPCLHRRLMPATRKPNGEAVVTLSRKVDSGDDVESG